MSKNLSSHNLSDLEQLNISLDDIYSVLVDIRSCLQDDNNQSCHSGNQVIKNQVNVFQNHGHICLEGHQEDVNDCTLLE